MMMMMTMMRMMKAHGARHAQERFKKVLQVMIRAMVIRLKQYRKGCGSFRFISTREARKHGIHPRHGFMRLQQWLLLLMLLMLLLLLLLLLGVCRDVQRPSPFIVMIFIRGHR